MADSARASERTWFQRVAARFGSLMVPLMGSSLARRLLGGAMGTLRYRGRRSGREFVLVVGYRRRGTEYVVRVAAPDQKSWWRNFTGDGAAVSLQTGETTITGHGRALRERDTVVVIEPDAPAA